MYDGIFDDFNTIKRHCKRNGNPKIEESAVFELLESLYPLYGSAETVQIILDMLDAQRIRDDKDSSNDNLLEDLNSDKSNDNDSIVEIEVPKKIHPIIDLTDNSPDSNEATIIEKSNNEYLKVESDLASDVDGNAFGAGDDEFPDLNDSELSKDFDDDWNKTIENIIKSRNELPFVQCLGLNEDCTQLNLNHLDGDQSNSGIAEIPEILEENNNDPNNNLDDRIFDDGFIDVNNTVDNNINRTVISNSENSNINNVFIDEVLDPIPGCSKDTDTKICIKNTKDLPYTLVGQPLSPIPGCSKDLDNSNDFESIPFDESIQNDAMCIQEIVPWANLQTIYSILKKHSDSPNRKQLTLWDLMSEESTQTIVNKRKQDTDICTRSSKIAKEDTNTDIDESSVDLIPNLQLNNVVCNESSNDSQTSRISECTESNSEMIPTNQNSTVNSSNELTIKMSNDSLLNKGSASPVNVKAEKQSSNNFTLPVPKITLNHSFNFTNRSIKIERNETIVSGLLNEDPIKQPIKTLFPLNNQLVLKERTVIVPNLSNGNNSKHDDNLNGNIQKDKHNAAKGICMTAEQQKLNASQNDESEFIHGASLNPLQEPCQKSTNIDVIRPAKLVLRQLGPANYEIKKPLTTSYIRPATFNYTNANPETDSNVKVREAFLPFPVVQRQNLAMPQSMPNMVQNLNHNQLQQLQVPRASCGNSPSIRIRMPTNPATSTVGPNSHKVQELVIAKKALNHSENCAKKSYIHIKTPMPYPVIQRTEPMKITPVQMTNVSEPSTSAENSNLIELDLTIYHKLRSIFPEVKSSYIKKICTNPPNIMNYNDKEYMLNSLIDHLLKEGHNYLRPVTNYIEETAIPLSVDKQYEYLLEIFPDADPTYLMDFVEKNINTEQVLEQFIQEKLETHDYPTKEQYLAKIKITEQQKQYTTDFKVEKFLELFPEPFKHFENKNRQCQFQPIGLEFLKSHFKKNKVSTISRQYITNNHNISLTAKALTALGPDMKSKRIASEMPTENIPLLQELAFVKNKKNIQNYLTSMEEKEQHLLKQLKEKNLLLTCQCCFNDECMPTKCSECNEGHVFCFECIIRGTESTLADGEAHVRCFTECSSEFSIAILQKILPPTKFSALLKKRQAAEVIAAEIEGLVSCPFCHFASIPPPEDKVFKCLNPECMKETCRQCKELNHVPLKCDEVVKSDKARRMIEEKMTEALIRTCYKCKRQFYKEEGCNRMTCPCGALMCYICDKPVLNYNHFNAQGGQNAHLCPLWSDDRRMNAESVRKVAEEVKNAILKMNPNLQIDTEAIMPKLPPKTKGPHDDIPNANQLPEHVRRVAGAAP